MIKVEIIDSLNDSKINDEKPRETIMEFVAENITKKIRQNDRRPVVLLSATSTGKSTYLLYNLWKQNPGFNIFCSQVTITNTQEIATSMSQMFTDLQMGLNLGFQTGIKKITPSQQGHIIYQTIKITSNQILKPLLFDKNNAGHQETQNFNNCILVIDEAHSNDINMQEQLALVREVLINRFKTAPFIIVQSASIILQDFKQYLQATFTIKTEGLRNKVSELYLDDFNINCDNILLRKHNLTITTKSKSKQILRGGYCQSCNLKNDDYIDTNYISQQIDTEQQKYENQLKYLQSEIEINSNQQIDGIEYFKQRGSTKGYKTGNKQKTVSKFVLATELVIMNILEQSNIIQKHVKEVNCDQNGNILVFICKSSQMRDLYGHLQHNKLIKSKNIPIIQLSAVSIEKDPTLIEQTKLPQQKIIIATSVVETGFTFTNLSYVIDGLKVRSVYYDPIKKCEVQRDLPIDKNMQQQRRGRVGRTQGGIYIGICNRNISDQLQAQKEYQIQTSDLKQLISSIGFENFKKMQFIGKIPVESILDVLQFQYLFGFQLKDSQKSQIFNTFMTDEKFKVKPIYKFLLMWSMLQNIKLCDMIMIVCFLVKYQTFSPSFTRKIKTKKYIKINQFATILQQIHDYNVIELPPQYIQLYNDIILICTQLQINIYSGISVLSQDIKEQEIVKKVFFDTFKQNILIHVKENIYKTFNGLSVIVDIQIQGSQKFPKYLVTNHIIDDLQISAQFVVECSLSDIQQLEFINN